MSRFGSLGLRRRLARSPFTPRPGARSLLVACLAAAAWLPIGPATAQPVAPPPSQPPPCSSAQACIDLARQAEAEGDWDAALSHSARLCELDAFHCDSYGYFLDRQGSSQAGERYLQACMAGNGSGCLGVQGGSASAGRPAAFTQPGEGASGSSSGSTPPTATSPPPPPAPTTPPPPAPPAEPSATPPPSSEAVVGGYRFPVAQGWLVQDAPSYDVPGFDSPARILASSDETAVLLLYAGPDDDTSFDTLFAYLGTVLLQDMPEVNQPSTFALPDGTVCRIIDGTGVAQGMGVYFVLQAMPSSGGRATYAVGLLHPDASEGDRHGFLTALSFAQRR